MLIHINGRPGTGKKTIAHALAKLLGARCVDSHVLLNPAVAVCGRGTPGYYRMKEVVRQAAYSEIEADLPTTAFVMTDALTNEETLHVKIFDELRGMAKNAGVSFVPVLLTCDAEENERRIVAPERQKDMKLTDAAELRRLFKTHSMIAPADGLTLDVTALTAEEAAKNLQKMICP